MLAALVIAASAPSRAADRVCPGSIPSIPINDHGLIYSIDAVGDLVVTIDQRGITTWTIADPANPTQLGHLEIAPEWLVDYYDTWWYPGSERLILHPSGEWACTSRYFNCFDLRDPTTPKPYRWIIDQWPCTPGSGDCSDTTFSRDRAALSRYGTIWLADISENSPTEWVSPEEWNGGFQNISSLSFAGDLLLVLEYDKTITAWDLTDPAHPIEVGRGTLGTDHNQVSGWKLYGHQDGALAGARVGYDLHLAAISTTDLPDLGSVDVSDRFDRDIVTDVQFAGDRGVALTREWDSQANEWIQHLDVIRVVAPLALYPGPSVEVTTRTIAVTSSHVIAEPWSMHLEVYRTENQIALEGTTPAVGESIDLDVEGNIGVIANGRAGITVIDLNNSEAPIIRSTLQIEDAIVEQVELQDSIAFLRTETGLASVDVSRPDTPTLIAHTQFPGICCDFQVNGDVAALGSNDNCKWSLIDVSNPAYPFKLSDSYYCEPQGSTRKVRRIDIIDDLVYVQAWHLLFRFDISNPRQPTLISEFSDVDFRGALPTRDFVFVIYDGPSAYNHLRLYEFDSDGSFVVGRVYDDLFAAVMDSPGRGLVATANWTDQHLIDFSNLIEPVVYQAPPTDYLLPLGKIGNDFWVRPFRHRLDLVSLECRPPEASFRWAGTELGIWFEDTSSYQVTERRWDFGDGVTSTERSPFHRFTEAGRYRVTLTVSNDLGSDAVTRLVHPFDAKPHTAPTAPSEAD